MNKRIKKKMVKRWFNGQLRTTKIKEDSGYGADGKVVKVLAVLHPAIESAIYKEWRKNPQRWGLTLCHWDNPIVMEMYDITTGNVYY